MSGESIRNGNLGVASSSICFPLAVNLSLLLPIEPHTTTACLQFVGCDTIVNTHRGAREHKHIFFSRVDERAFPTPPHPSSLNRQREWKSSTLELRDPSHQTKWQLLRHRLLSATITTTVWLLAGNNILPPPEYHSQAITSPTRGQLSSLSSLSRLVRLSLQRRP